MSPSKTEVADLLERAADLYESEQIDWCKGSWGTPTLFEGHLDDTPRRGQFHCAEGAIFRAAGFTMEQIVEAQQPKETYIRSYLFDEILSTPVVNGAMDAVNEHLGQLGLRRLYYYNDNLLPVTAKQTLIQIFKETAKELRNGS